MRVLMETRAKECTGSLPASVLQPHLSPWVAKCQMAILDLSEHGGLQVWLAKVWELWGRLEGRYLCLKSGSDPSWPHPLGWEPVEICTTRLPGVFVRTMVCSHHRGPKGWSRESLKKEGGGLGWTSKSRRGQESSWEGPAHWLSPPRSPPTLSSPQLLPPWPFLESVSVGRSGWV